jgi:sn-glycerol 3-phosphate transport system substrate-binding protein
VTRLKKWIDDGVMQIAGQGLSPEQLYTSGKCSTFFASTAAHGSVERNAKIKWSATYLPWEEGTTPRNSSIGGATIWAMKGQKAEDYDGVADFLAFVASPDLQVWWSKVTGYVPITNKAYQQAKQEGYYKENPTREIAILQLNRGTPTANSQGFHFGNYTQSTFALRQEMEALWAGKKAPQEALDDAVRRGNEILRQFEKLYAGKY